MSITFRSNASQFTSFTKVEPCLCAQMSEGFFAMMRGEDSEEVRASLKAGAWAECSTCRGSGVDLFVEDDSPRLNFCNDNFRRLMAVLGLEPEDNGEMALASARRALMRARSRRDLTPFERPAEALYGAPRATPDGVVELRPLRMASPALLSGDLLERVERFGAFVEESATRGATIISWG